MSVWPERGPAAGTWYVVALGLDASGEVGVLWD